MRRALPCRALPRRGLPRLRVVALAVALCAAVTTVPVVLPAGPAAVTAAPAAASAPPVVFGLSDHWYPDYRRDDYQLRIHEGIYGTFANWGTWQPSAAVNFFTWARGRGGVPMMSFDPPAGTSLATINSGRYDATIAAWARATSAYGHPVLVRLFPEMNLSQHDWTLYKHTGNTPYAFRAAWRRVVTVWRANDRNHAGRFVFNPNRVYTGEPGLANFWPGAGYVDWMAIDAYNWNTPTLSIRSLLAPTITALRALSATKPIFVAELGSVEYAGKAAWLKSIPAVASSLGLKAVVYWDESPTRLDTSWATLGGAWAMVRTAPMKCASNMPRSAIEHLARYGY